MMHDIAIQVCRSISRDYVPTLSRLIAAVFALCLLASGAIAQEYEQQALAKDSSGTEIRTWTMLANTNESKTALDMLSGSAPLDNAAFDKFFNSMMFPLFTQWQEFKARGKTYSPLLDIAPMVSPAKMRFRFKQEYANRATNPAAHERLNQLALAAMDHIANGNFHPVCRYTAMMFIGDLNETEPNGPPYKKALPYLVKAVSANNTIPHVRLAAWRGVVRHAAGGLDAENRALVNSAALAALKQHTPPPGRSQVEHNWICRRAIDALAAIGEPGSGGAVTSALQAAINDDTTSLSIRCAAAEALPAVKLNPQQTGDASQFVKTLGKLAVEESKTQLANAKVNNTKIPVDELKMHLAQVRKGLTAMTSAPNVTPPVNQLLGQIDNLSRACDTKPAESLASTGLGTVGAGPTIPTDTQAPIAKAIAAAGESLETTLVGGNGAAAGSTFP